MRRRVKKPGAQAEMRRRANQRRERKPKRDDARRSGGSARRNATMRGSAARRAAVDVNDPLIVRDAWRSSRSIRARHAIALCTVHTLHVWDAVVNPALRCTAAESASTHARM
jgi:hypothetical protein